MIYVTHDQSEALILSDRIAVMSHGRFVQVGSPRELYNRPADAFVADFVGESNFLSARLERADHAGGTFISAGGLVLAAALRGNHGGPGGNARIMFRPERVFLGPDADGMPNRFRGTVDDAVYVGEATRYRIALPGGECVTARRQNVGDDTALTVGAEVWVGFRAADTIAFPD